MKEGQRVQGGREHLLHFLDSQGPLEKDLIESLVGIFHDDEEKLAASELAQTCIEKPNQVRMG